MPKYNVHVSYTTTRVATFVVDADSPEQAEDDVMNVHVGDHDFGEELPSDPVIECEAVHEVPERYEVPADLLATAAFDEDDKLGDVIHDLFSRNATDVNNQGYEGQLEFIMKTLGRDAGIKAIKEALNHDA